MTTKKYSMKTSVSKKSSIRTGETKKATIKRRSARRSASATITLNNQQLKVLQDLEKANPGGLICCYLLDVGPELTFSVEEAIKIKSSKNVSDLTAGLVYPPGSFSRN